LAASWGASAMVILGPEALWISLQRVREVAIGITVAKEVFIPTG